MKAGIKFCINFLLFLVALNVAAQKPTASEIELRKKADKQFEQQDYAGASPLYSQLLSLFPLEPVLNYRYGVCLMEAGKEKTQSITYLDFASKSPGMPEELWAYLGKAYMLAANYSKARSALSTCKSRVNSSKAKTLELNLLLSNCNNAEELLRSRKDIAIVNSQDVKLANFTSSYDFSETGVKLVPTAAQFLSSLDKQKQKNPMMFMTKDGQSIYYSSYGKGSGTGKDIYLVRKMVNGQWGVPENLGPVLNSSEDEDYPYLDRDGRTLYFCSRGHNSIGGYDIFRSVFDYNTNQWSVPENLGIPVNTSADEFFFVPNLNGDKATYSTNFECSPSDVQVRNISLGGVSNRFAVVSGVYYSLDQATRRDARITVLRAEDNAVLNSVHTDPKSGKYELVLPPGRDYILVVEGGSYLPHAEEFSLPDLAVSGMRQEVKLNRDKEREQMTLVNYFTPVSIQKDQAALAFRDSPTNTSTTSIHNSGADSSLKIPVRIDDKIIYVNDPKQKQTESESLIPARPESVANYGYNSSIAENKDAAVNEVDSDADNKGLPGIQLKAKDKYDPTLAEKISEDEIRQMEEEKERAQIVEEEEKNPSVLIDFNIDNEELAKIAIEDAKSSEDEAERMRDEATRLKTNASLQDSLAITLMNEADNLPASEASRRDELKSRAIELKTEAYSMKKQASDLLLQSSIKMDESRAAKRDAEAILNPGGKSATLASNSGTKTNSAKTRARQSIAENAAAKDVAADSDVANENINKVESTTDNSRKTVVDTKSVDLKNQDETIGDAQSVQSDKPKADHVASPVTKSPDPESAPVALNADKKLTTDKTDVNKVNDVSAENVNPNDKLSEGSVQNKSAIPSKQVSDGTVVLGKSGAKDNSSVSSSLKSDESGLEPASASTSKVNKTENSHPAEDKNSISTSGENQVDRSKVESKKDASPSQADRVDETNVLALDSDSKTVKSVQMDDAQKSNGRKEPVSGEKPKEPVKEPVSVSVTQKQTTIDSPKTALNQKSSPVTDNSSVKSVDLNQARGSDPLVKDVITSETQNPAIDNNSVKDNSADVAIKSTSDKNNPGSNSVVSDQAKSTVLKIKSDSGAAPGTTSVSPDEERSEIQSSKDESSDRTAMNDIMMVQGSESQAEKSKALAVQSDINPGQQNGPESSVSSDIPTKEEQTSLSQKLSPASEGENQKSAINDKPEEAGTLISSAQNDGNSGTSKESSSATNDNSVRKESEVNPTGNSNALGMKSENSIASKTVNSVNTASSSTVPATTFTKPKYKLEPGVEEKIQPEAKVVFDSYVQNVHTSETLFRQSRTLQERVLSMPRSPERDSLLAVSNSLSRESNHQYNIAQSQLQDAIALDSSIAGSLVAEAGSPLITPGESTDEKTLANQDTGKDFADQFAERKTDDKTVNELALNESIHTSKIASPETNTANKALKLSEEEAMKQPLSRAEITPENSASPVSKTGTEGTRTASKSSEEENNDQQKTTGTTQNENKTEDDNTITDATVSDKAPVPVPKLVTPENTTRVSVDEEGLNAEIAAGEVVKDEEGLNTNHPKYSEYKAVEKKITENQVTTINLFAEGVNLNKKSVEEKQQQVNLMDSAQNVQDDGIRAELLRQADELGRQSDKDQLLSKEKFSASQQQTHVVKSLTSEMEAIRKEISIDSNTANSLPVATEDSKRKQQPGTVSKQGTTSGDDQNTVLALNAKTTEQKSEEADLSQTELESFSVRMFSVGEGPAYSKVNPIPLNPGLPEGLVFKVQIGAFRKPIADDSFKNLQPISAETTRPGWLRYCVGLFKTFEPANLVKKSLHGKGYKDAFVVAYFNGQRVSLSEANAILNRQDNALAYTGEMNREITALRQLNLIPVVKKSRTRDNDEQQFYAERKAPELESLISPSVALEYSVQVGVYRNATPPSILDDLQPIYTEALNKGLYRFTSGRYSERSSAEKAKSVAIGKGISDAFVVAFRGNKKLSSVPAVSTIPDKTPSIAAPAVNDESKSIPESVQSTLQGIRFKVQLGAFRQNVPFEVVEAFLKISDKGIVRVKDERGLNIFYAGDFTSYEQARELKETIVSEGVKDAFVVAISDGKRVPLKSVLPKEE